MGEFVCSPYARRVGPDTSSLFARADAVEWVLTGGIRCIGFSCRWAAFWHQKWSPHSHGSFYYTDTAPIV